MAGFSPSVIGLAALLGKERYAVVVETRHVSHVVYACEPGYSYRGGIRSGSRGFFFETPAASDSVDAHGIVDEENVRDEEGFEPLLKPLGVIFVKDNEGVGEGVEVGKRRERHRVDHSEEDLEILSGILYVDYWGLEFTLLGRLGR